MLYEGHAEIIENREKNAKINLSSAASLWPDLLKQIVYSLRNLFTYKYSKMVFKQFKINIILNVCILPLYNSTVTHML